MALMAARLRENNHQILDTDLEYLPFHRMACVDG